MSFKRYFLVNFANYLSIFVTLLIVNSCFISNWLCRAHTNYTIDALACFFFIVRLLLLLLRTTDARLLNLLWFDQHKTRRINIQKLKEADTSWEFTLWKMSELRKQAKQIFMKAAWPEAKEPEAKSLEKEKTAVQRSSQNGNRRILNKIDWKVSFKCRSPWTF